MKNKLIAITLIVITGFSFFQTKLLAQGQDIYKQRPDIPGLPPVTKEDRVLIMAPHPDDETLGAAGIIQEAVKAGAEVKILYLTNGEHNQLAFILYERRIVIKKKAIINMGELRQKEALGAMKVLGVPEENLIFLGYPDFGTLMIFSRHWGDEKPFKNMMLGVSSVPYMNALTPNAPYKGEAILWDIKSVLKKYKPTKIFVTSPVDTNRDHRALYLFLQVALWDLKAQIPQPGIYPYIIHCYGWPRPRNYHPLLYLPVPKLLEKSRMSWFMYELSDEEIEKKHKASLLYKTQYADSAFYLNAFSRKNELFGNYPLIELAEIKDKDDSRIAAAFHEKVVTYGKSENKLLINVFSKGSSTQENRFYVNLAPYNSAVDFSQMPKLKINVDFSNVKILDRGRFAKGFEEVEVERKKNSVLLKIPFSILQNPEYILASVNTYTENYVSDLNAWRVIKVK